MSTARRAAFSTAERVAHWVHGRSSGVWTATHPAFAASLPEFDVHVLGKGNDTDSGPAVRAHTSHLSGWQRDLCPVLFTSTEYAAGASTSTQLTSAPRLEFNVVNSHPEWNFTKRHAVTDAGLNVLGPTHHLVTCFEAFGSEDVAFFAVVVLDQCDPRSSIWIVFDGDHSRYYIVLGSLEVDQSIPSFVTATAESYCRDSLVVSSAFLRQRTKQGLLGFFLFVSEVRKITDGSVTATSACRLIFSNSHCLFNPLSGRSNRN